MKQLTGAMLALAVLLIIGVGCGTKVPQEIPFQAPSAVPAVTATVGPLTFNQRVEKLNPSLQRYVKRLYKEYAKSTWNHRKWSKLDAYIKEVHKRAEKQYKFNNPMTDREIQELSYGINVYSTKWKHSPRDLSVSYMTHESGFLDIVGDKIDKKTKQTNPPERCSIGQGQVQLETARGNLRARGYDPTGLTTDDLLYFRLMNMDISICVMSAKVRDLGRKCGLQAYNGGDNGWKDGRSLQYYRDVMAVYKQRAKWTEIEQ
jgi:predicted small lipoprotein YifL